MKITRKDILSFKKMSGDNNRIHFDEKYAKKFFFKKPIVHGVNLAIKGIFAFLKKKNKKIVIKDIKIKFKNFTYIYEEIKFKIVKNKIIIYSDLNEKVEIDILIQNFRNKKIINNQSKFKNLRKNNYKNLINSELIDQLIFISSYIGTVKPGNGSLIHQIYINFNLHNTKDKKIKFKKKTRTIYIIQYLKNCFQVEIISSKLVPFYEVKKREKIPSKYLKFISNKKILIFGPSSDVAKRLNKIFKHKFLIFNHSFKIDFENPIIKKNEFIKMEKKIKKIKPNFIFYLSSPYIYNGKKNNKKLLNFYNVIYVSYFKNILEVVKKNNFQCKVFYPSTFALNRQKEFKRLECYLTAKRKGEELCKSSKFNKIAFFYRLPQLISRSNYNILGYYEGEDLKVLDRYFKRFIK